MKNSENKILSKALNDSTMHNSLKTSSNRKEVKGLLSGGLIGSAAISGKGYIYKMMIRHACSYIRTMWFFLRKGEYKMLRSLLYTKVFVPVGEAAGGVFYIFFGNYVRRHPGMIKFPKYMEFEPTTVCNVKCIMCENTHWEDQKKKNMSFDEMKHLIDQYPDLRWTNITGMGSSFLNKDFIPTLQYLKDKGVFVAFVDHFLGTDEKVARQLIGMKIDSIYVSMDGATAETYNKIRPGSNFDTVYNNLKRFVELKKELGSPIPELCFRFTITEENAHEVPDFVDLVASLGTRRDLGDGARIDFGGLLSFNAISGLETDMPTEVAQEALRRAKIHKLDILFQHTGYTTDENTPMEKCLCWTEPYTFMDGYVVQCCSVMMSDNRAWLRENSLGNINDQSMKEIWDSERYVALRKAINNPNAPVPKLCAGCRAFDTMERVKRVGIADDY